jgi:hypothetical protein
MNNEPFALALMRPEDSVHGAKFGRLDRVRDVTANSGPSTLSPNNLLLVTQHIYELRQYAHRMMLGLRMH